MLVLKRKEGQWVEIIHRSGDVIRVRLYDIQAISGMPSRANLAFDDAARNFEIRRPERRTSPQKPPQAPAVAAEAEAPAARINIELEANVETATRPAFELAPLPMNSGLTGAVEAGTEVPTPGVASQTDPSVASLAESTPASPTDFNSAVEDLPGVEVINPEMV